MARPRRQPAQKSWKQSSRHGRSYCAWHSGHTRGWPLAASRVPRPSRGAKIAPDIGVDGQLRTVKGIPGAQTTTLLPSTPGQDLASGFGMMLSSTGTMGSGALLGEQLCLWSLTSLTVLRLWLCRGVFALEGQVARLDSPSHPLQFSAPCPLGDRE